MSGHKPGLLIPAWSGASWHLWPDGPALPGPLLQALSIAEPVGGWEVGSCSCPCGAGLEEEGAPSSSKVSELGEVTRRSEGRGSYWEV